MLNQNPSTFTFNGHSSAEFGIRIERKPDLNRSGRKFKTDSVAGRNGNIYQLQDAWDEVIVAYDIYAGGRNKGDVIPAFTAIIEWLNSADDYAVLTDSYDPDHYRLAVYVDSMDIESQWYTIGKATVKFRCQPQRFIVEEPITVSSGDTIVNSTNHIAKPSISMTGGGACSLLNLNKQMYGSQTPYSMATLQQMLYVSSTLAYAFWVRPSTNISNGIDWVGSSIGGTVSEITNSTGTITFTPSSTYGVGVLYQVTPSTTYTLSFNTNRANCALRVIYAENTPPFRITNIHYSSLVSGLNTRTFTIPAYIGYVLLVFVGVQSSSSRFSSIMLNGGDTRLSFKAYSDPFANTVQIGNTALQFMSSGFDTAEIDCEKENFVLDGINANTNVAVVENGGLVPEYLQIPKGNSTVTFTGDIQTMTMQKNLWEL